MMQRSSHFEDMSIGLCASSPVRSCNLMLVIALKEIRGEERMHPGKGKHYLVCLI